MSTNRYRAEVWDRGTKLPAANVRVEAYDLLGRITEIVAAGLTDRHGMVEIEVDEVTVLKLFGDNPPVLFFRVYSGVNIIGSTEKTSRWDARTSAGGRIEVDVARPVGVVPGASYNPTYVVDGKVIDGATGEPLTGRTVKVFRRTIAAGSVAESDVTIGIVTTAAPSGGFRASYASGEARPDILVAVYDGLTLLGKFSITGASPREFRDIVVGGTETDRNPGRTHFNYGFNRVADLNATVALDSYTGTQIEFAAQKTGLDREEVTRLVDARKVAVAAALGSQTTNAAAEIYYALIQRGMGSTADEIFSKRLPALRRELEEAANRRLIAPARVAAGAITSLENDLETRALAVMRINDSKTRLGRLVDLVPTTGWPTGAEANGPTSASTFLKLLFRFEGRPEDFWSAVDAEDVRNLNSMAKLRYRVVAEANVITGGFKAAAEQIAQALNGTTVPNDAKWLATLTESGWSFVTSFPTNFATLSDYRKFLVTSAESRFMTAAARAKTSLVSAKTFLQNNATFEFEKERFSNFVSRNNLTIDPTTRAQMRQLERQLNLCSNLVEVEALQAAGFTSASAIHAVGAQNFFNAAGIAALATPVKQAIFNKACWAASSAPIVRSMFSPKFLRHSNSNLFASNVSLPTVSLPSALADWQDLFGSADSCKCEHGESVLSPAAYLVDVLQTLARVRRSAPGSTSETARTELFLRRPDIPRLALSDRNATTLLPYVDILNELMEVRLHQPLASFTWPQDGVQSPDPADHLTAHPDIPYVAEHIGAYRTLEASRHPLDTPFHLWLEEARVYLDYLGVTRQRLLEVFTPEGASPNARLHFVERMRSTPRTYDMVTATTVPSPDPWLDWGLTSTYLTTLRKVKTWMEKGGLTYDEVREVLKTRLFSPALDFTTNTCDLETLEITPMTDVQAHRLNRFLRLWKASGWSISELAALFAISGGSAFDAGFVITVGGIRDLSTRLGLGAKEVGAWFGDMDRNSAWESSLYRKTFLDPRLGPARKPFADLEPDPGTTLAVYSDHLNLIASALQVSEQDVLLLTDAATATAQLGLSAELSSGAMTVAGLSTLFRVASLSRAMKRSISEVQVLRAFNGTSPFANPEETLKFLRSTDHFTRTNLSTDELQYILRGFVRETNTILAPSEETLSAEDAELVALLEKVAGEARLVADPGGQLLESLGKQVLSDTVSPTTTQLLTLANDKDAAGNATTLTGLAPFLSDSVEATSLLLNPTTQLAGPADRRTYLAQQFTSYVGRRNAALTWSSSLTDVSLEVMSLLLGRPQFDTAGPEVGILRPASGAPLDLLRTLMNPAAFASNRTAIAHLLLRVTMLLRRLKFEAADLKYLHDTSLNARTGVTAPTFFLKDLPQGKPTLPSLVPAQAANPTFFQGLLAWTNLAWTRDRWGTGPTAFYAFMNDTTLTTPAAAVARIAIENGFQESDVSAVANRLGYTTAAALRTVAALRRIFEGMEVIRRLGVSASLVVGSNGGGQATERGWLAVDAELPNQGTDVEMLAQNALVLARQMKTAARARAGEAAWSDVGKSVRDPLRQRQRKALVSALLTKLSLRDSAELYENLLIDVEMTPCMLTSRLVCAHGSVQTFINRIQMNLEASKNLLPNVQLSREWDWMHAYRLWEANRKVFLWPENWIEPELRDTKTPIFENLESALLQGPLDNETAEKAYRAYLDDLAEVANLEMVALHEEKANGVTKLHVIGRSNKPYRYYHRVRASDGWTPWKKIDADIQGDHVVAISVSGVLYLFWLLIEDDPKQPLSAAADAGDVPLPEGIAKLEQMLKDNPDAFIEPLRSHFQQLVDNAKAKAQVVALSDAQKPAPIGGKVSLSVAELRHGAWTTLTSGSDHAPLDASPSRSASSFRASVSGSEIVVRMGHGLEQRLDAVEFRFDVGSRRVRARKGYGGIGETLGVLNDPTGVFASQTLCTTSVKAGGGSYANYNANGVPEYQRFASDNANVNVFVTKNSDARLWLLNVATPLTTRVIIPRNSTSRDQPYLIVQDRGRSLLASRIRKLVRGNAGELALAIINANGSSASPPDLKVTFDTYDLELLYHPFVDDFRRRIALSGLDGLLRPSDLDDLPQYKETSLATLYSRNTALVPDPMPKEIVDFEPRSPYGIYNWEVFFHAPFLIANRLRQEGRYAEARAWYHMIFDPTDGTSVPSANAHARYWKFRPFAENPDLATIQSQLTTLAQPQAQYLNSLVSKPNYLAKPDSSLQSQIDRWRKDPFDPHAIASLRRVAYQKAVVLKYIENLIAWGDDLFTQDTMETVDQAAQLYIHALQIIGRRPQVISKPTSTNVSSYNQLGANIDAFGNAFIETEGVLANLPEGGASCTGAAPALGASLAGELYFCVPENDALVGLWDTIDDRLFKIRQCQNIEGVVRQLPLFQPPIDPALLVRAKASGVDLNSVLRDISVSPPPYRYAVLAARAIEYTNALTSLGASFLSALEKRDAEELSLLRSKHEVATQETTRDIRRNQIEEAQENLASLKNSKKLAEGRRDYYSSRSFMNGAELKSLAIGASSALVSIGANLIKASGAAVSAGPDTIVGISGITGTPHVTVKVGAENPSRASIGAGDALEAVASAMNRVAADTGTIGSYQRRADDWEFQAEQAATEIEQIEKQIIAAEIRVAIARQELKLLEQNLRQSKEIESHLRTKFTSKDLYGWMVGQLGAVYFQSYKLAYEMARQAERAFQRERGDSAQTFIKFGAWDGIKRGLLSGEKLGLDLRRMDAAYHTQNTREQEVTKTVSLSHLDPTAFLTLRESTNGTCDFSLPEQMFDEDFPSHYLRRIKSVSVTLQCNPGPYQSVHGTLELKSCGIRKKAIGAAEPDVGPVSRMVTSGAMNDTGLFEFNFRDERYLPFEFRGVHSDGTNKQWGFSLSQGNEFNYDSISDLVLQLRYTARDGRTVPSPTVLWTPRHVLMRIPETHADLWAAFKEGSSSEIIIPTNASTFTRPRGRKLHNVQNLKVFVRTSTAAATSGPNVGLQTPVTVVSAASSAFPAPTVPGTFFSREFSSLTVAADASTSWKVLVPNTITDLWLAFTYSLTAAP